MMTRETEFQVVPAEAADADLWDAFVNAHALGTPYHAWGWKTAMENSYQLKTSYLCAKNNDGAIIGVCPVAHMPSVFGLGSACSLPYCDRGEPLADRDAVAHGLLDSVGGDFAHEVRATTGQDDPDEWVTSQIADGAKVRLLLDLPNSSQELMASFKSKHRSQIRKAEKNGLEASVAPGVSRVAAFYSVFTRNMRDLGSPTHSLRWFEEVARSYGKQCLVGLVTLEGKTIGAGIVLISGKRAVIPWASTLREYNRLAPNMLLYWKLLEAVTDIGCRSFDFGRSSYGEGTYRFKTQWGAKPVPLNWYTQGSHVTGREPTEPATGQSRLVRKIVESIWRKLPLATTVLIGSRIRPWVSL